jgi:hypothetical protein
MRNKSIFIATNSIDSLCVQPVAEYIGAAGYNPIVYESDKVFAGQKALWLSFDSAGQELQAEYAEQTISRETVAAAWYRRPSQLQLDMVDKAKQFRIETEVRTLQRGLWSVIPDERWLNAPANIRITEDKLTQFAVAKQVGFLVPTTVVSNSWKQVRDMLPAPLIMKMQSGILHDNGKLKLMYTTVLDEQALDKQATSKPFPGIFQEYIPKAREWRITVVGEEVFSAAVYTTGEAKTDWRKYQSGNDVEFRSEKINTDIQEKCIKFLQKVGLTYGAFDFIESPDGRITFLEVNPNGQYMWLESRLGLPISRAIGAKLIDIARTNNG